jgi:hypothetical protein
MREARKRDASMYLDYGFTRPNVISQGPYEQLTGEGCETQGLGEGIESLGPAPEPMSPSEVLPPPQPPTQQGSMNSASIGGPQSNGNVLASHQQPAMIDERQANNPAAEAAATAPVWEWAKR